MVLRSPYQAAACPTPTPAAAAWHLALGRQVVTAANSWLEGGRRPYPVPQVRAGGSGWALEELGLVAVEGGACESRARVSCPTLIPQTPPLRPGRGGGRADLDGAPLRTPAPPAPRGPHRRAHGPCGARGGSWQQAGYFPEGSAHPQEAGPGQGPGTHMRVGQRVPPRPRPSQKPSVSRDAPSSRTAAQHHLSSHFQAPSRAASSWSLAGQNPPSAMPQGPGLGGVCTSRILAPPTCRAAKRARGSQLRVARPLPQAPYLPQPPLRWVSRQLPRGRPSIWYAKCSSQRPRCPPGSPLSPPGPGSQGAGP